MTTSTSESIGKIYNAFKSTNQSEWEEVNETDIKVASSVMGPLMVIVGALLLWGGIEGFKSLSGCNVGTQAFVGTFSTLTFISGLGLIYSGFTLDKILAEKKAQAEQAVIDRSDTLRGLLSARDASYAIARLGKDYRKDDISDSSVLTRPLR